jgi:tetratricopeptide (TPR) repeat protein
MSQGFETSAPSDSGVSDFKQCLKHLRDGHHDEALADIGRALRTAPDSAIYLSYAGLLAALAERRFRDGVQLCLEALKLQHKHPQLYLNLAQVYQRAGRFEEAVEVLEKGFTSTGRDPKIRCALGALSKRLRRKPVLPFFDRSNPMNRVLGKWRHRLMGPIRAL